MSSTEPKKLILLEQWGAVHFDPPPSLWTLREMGRKGRILPKPVRIDGVWLVDPDAQLSAEPPPAVRRGSDLPERTELYRHFDGSGRLLYVGISLSTAGRMSQHRLTGRWADQVATITIQRFATRAEALAAELEAIRTEKPLHNKIGKGKTAATRKTASLSHLVTDPAPGAESPLQQYFRERGIKPRNKA